MAFDQKEVDLPRLAIYVILMGGLSLELTMHVQSCIKIPSPLWFSSFYVFETNA